jgi:hypothetical protein
VSKTIGRNSTRKIVAIRKRATVCTVKSLSNDFIGRFCEPGYAWDELYRYPFARLIEYADHWTIQVHGNLWYELREPTP